MAYRSPALLLLAAFSAAAQQPQPPAAPIASIAVQGVTLHGVLSVSGGRATLANNTAITAGDATAEVTLERGGKLLVCTGTTIHIAKDIAPHTAARPGDAGLLISLDRGALEGHYTPGAFADEILTPDLRLLVSAPGIADLKLRVNASGDTCVDNAGANPPYVIAGSLMNNGIYRIQPGQRVLFVHGSVARVVDNEHEPCGCPPDLSQPLAQNGAPAHAAKENEFPLAVSEGLKSPPKLSGPPIVPEGVPHAQVTATFSSSTPPGPPPPGETAPPANPAAPPSAPPGTAPHHRGVFGSIGHFFAHIFGAGS